jgi:competence protein ComFC
LDRNARQTNIIGAFELLREEVVRDKNILIFDDVFTTGATVREAVKVLWNADPTEIDILTLARTLNPE